MANELIPQNPLLRAAERVRAKREAERAAGIEPVIAPITVLPPQKHSATVRARLNFVPDDETLGGMIHNALAALSRGVRWARGSISNLLV